MAIAATLIFTSCGSDDDNSRTCETCEVLDTVVCDNGDGTVTVTTARQDETFSEDELEGVSPSDFIAQFQATCELLDDIEFDL